MAKIIVLGLDALDPSFLDYMPNLRSLKHIYRMDSLIPLTPPSWTSIMSGVNPGKHGILDFMDYSVEDNALKRRLVTALDLKYPRIHEILYLSRAWKRVSFAIINPVPSYPLTIPDIPNSLVASIDFFNPKIIATNMVRLSKYYDLESLKNILDQARRSRSCRDHLRDAERIIGAHLGALNDMANNYDLVWVNLRYPDTFLHKCPQSLYGREYLLKELLNRLDSMVEKALENSEYTIIVSDHGFKAYPGKVRINALLYKYGFLKISRKEGDTSNIGGRGSIVIGGRLSEIILRISRGPLRGIIRRSYYALSSITSRLTGKKLMYKLPGKIDFMGSKAYIPAITNLETPHYYILLNDQGIKDHLVKLLRENGLYAYKSEELFWGPHVPHDRIIVYSNRYAATPGTIYDQPILEEKGVDHARYGVLAFKKLDEEIIKDPLPGYIITPLILKLLDIPLDKYMDELSIIKRKYFANYKEKWNLYLRVLRLKLGFANKGRYST